MNRSAIAVAAALLLLILAMAAKPALLALPSVPEQVATGSFDTGRAIARLARILGDQAPHPVDSAASDAVRGRLVAELKAIGLSPVVTDHVDCNGTPRSQSVNCARIRNVRASIGPAAGRHLLLVSHYDSTPVGPGAADDGIGVAVMLEVASLLKDRPLDRPITFLFDEGEEAGLNGARAFLRHDPLAEKVDSAINLESRGVSGPAIMFETSRPNGAAIASLKAGAWRPFANSLNADFYSLIPNDTDVSVFRERPWTILNFALIGNETRYHSPGDRIEALDPRSVRHMGEQALQAATAMVRRASSGPGERVYADLLGRALIVLPAGLAWALLGLLTLGAAWGAWHRRSGLGRGTLSIIAAIVAAGAAAFLAQFAIGWVRDFMFWRGHPEIIGVAIDITALAAVLITLTAMGRRCADPTLRIAFWLVFLLIGCLLCLVAPGAVIFFLLPPLLALFGMAVDRRIPGAERVLGLVAWLLLFLTWAPLLYLSEVLLDFGLAWIFATIAALILLPAVIELKSAGQSLPARGWSLPVVGLAIASWVALAFAPAYTADRKQPFGIEYAREPHSARWLVVNDGAALPPGFSGFEPGVKISWSSRRRWAAPAPLLPMPAPMLERLGETVTPLGRHIRLRFHASGNDALILRAESDAGFIAVRAGGAITRFGLAGPKDVFALRCSGRYCDRLVVDLLLRSRAPVSAKLIGLRYTLPAQARALLAARPADAAPQYTPDATVSVVPTRL
jgi:hypothetical protein